LAIELAMGTLYYGFWNKLPDKILNFGQCFNAIMEIEYLTAPRYLISYCAGDEFRREFLYKV